MNRLLLLLLCLPLLLTACMDDGLTCTDPLGCVEVRTDQPVHVAYLLATSGPADFLGEDALRGIEIAVADRSGGLLGHPIELIGRDSTCEAEAGREAAQQLVADQRVVGIVGPTCSDVAEAIVPLINRTGQVLISPSATGAQLTNPDMESGGVWREGILRTAHNNLMQASLMAEYAHGRLDARRAVILDDSSAYSLGLEEVFAERFTELGGVILYQGTTVGLSDSSDLLRIIATGGPDVIYLPIFEPFAGLVLSEAATVPGLEDVAWLAADSLLTESFPRSTGGTAVGMYITGPHTSGDAYDAFLEKWDVQFEGTTPTGPFHAHAYDAMNLLLDGIETVAQVSADGTLLIGRQALREYLTAVADYDGVTGQLSCAPTGDCAGGESLAVYQITEDETMRGNWPPPVVWQP